MDDIDSKNGKTSQNGKKDAKGKQGNRNKANDKADKKDKRRKPSQAVWVVQIFFISVCLSAVLSFISNEALGGAGLLAAFGILLGFIFLGIFFDIIGVAVTAADERPFHSMAAHREPGAREALGLIRKAGRVSSFCNDVIGDICGIVTGTTAAVIVVRLEGILPDFPFRTVILSLSVTALASGLTIGGKAIGKALAIEKSTAVLHLTGRFLHLFSRKR